MVRGLDGSAARDRGEEQSAAAAMSANDFLQVMQRSFVKSSYILGFIALVWAGAIAFLHFIYIHPGINERSDSLGQAVIFSMILSIGFAVLMIFAIQKVVLTPMGRLLNRVERLRLGGQVESLSKDLRGEAQGLAREFEEVLSRVERLSDTDSLTGVCNRRSFLQAFAHEIDRTHRYGRSLALAVMDIDFFKAVNDVFGHQSGDRILKVFAEVISQNVRTLDTVARLGGDEFAILMPETTADEAVPVIERIRTCLAKKTVGHGELKMSLTISVGVVDVQGENPGTPEDIIDLADQAMYSAKRNGRNRIVKADELEVTGDQSVRDGGKDNLIRTQLACLDAKFKNLFVETIRGLTFAMEARDSHTINHSAKVCRYAMLIARKMHLPERTVKHIGQAAILHDIGKISLPDSLLMTETDLTDQQWSRMKKLPVISAQIMEGMGFLDTEIPAVRFHHENYDGTGYPDGLSGPAIPVGARILAVADAFDAMTSSRTFRGSLPMNEAIEEIRRCSGTQFDPAVVEAFMNVVESGDITDKVVAAEVVTQSA